MTQRSTCVTLVTLLLATSPAWASSGHHRDRDRARITSWSDAPDPFSPPSQSSKLSIVTAIRKVTGLGGWEEDDDDDCDHDRGGRRNHRKHFQATVKWTIRQGSYVLRQIEKTVEITAPLSVVRLPTRGSRKLQKFALIPMELLWDGRNANGQLASPETYTYDAVAAFTRTHEHRGRTKIKFIDESDPVTGTITVLGRPAPPTLDPSPATTTNIPILTLSGGKPENTSILLDGVVMVAQNASTTWSITKTLVEGINSFELRTRSNAGIEIDSDPVIIKVLLDSIPPPPPTVTTPPTDVTNSALKLAGTKQPGDAIVINGVVVVAANDSTTWSVAVTLNPGDNSFVVEAQDAAGNRSITQGGQIAGVVRSKPVIGNLTITPPIVPTGQPVTIAYKLFAGVPPADNADLRVNISIEDGDRLVRTVFAGVQQGGPTGLPYTISWDGMDDSGLAVPVNTSYKIVVSADREQPTTQPAVLVNANPKESSITVTASQRVASPDGKLNVIFRPDDAVMKIEPVTLLTAKQALILSRRQIRPLGKPYRIKVDVPFAGPVVGILKHPRPAGRLLRAYKFDEYQQDWMPIARTTWNPVEQTLAFAIPAQGMILIGSTPDAEPPRVTAFRTPPGMAEIRVADRGSGINPEKTRVNCRGVDITGSTTTQNLNGTRDQVLRTRDASARTGEGELVVYLEDWSGNGKLHRVKGGPR